MEENACERKREGASEQSDCYVGLTLSEREREGKKIGWRHLKMYCSSKKSSARLMRRP